MLFSRLDLVKLWLATTLIAFHQQLLSYLVFFFFFPSGFDNFSASFLLPFPVLASGLNFQMPFQTGLCSRRHIKSTHIYVFQFFLFIINISVRASTNPKVNDNVSF